MAILIGCFFFIFLVINIEKEVVKISIKSYFKRNYHFLVFYEWLKTLDKYYLSDEKFIRKQFLKRLNRPLNLDHPLYYNDKIQWLKLYNRQADLQVYADKLKVRNYIERKIGAAYLNDLIGVYDRVEEIPFDLLPDQYVIKTSHGSGHIILCHDKNKMDYRDIRSKLNWWLRRDYYYQNREWVYKDMEKKILIEPYLIDPSGDLKDYKIFCFHGQPKLIQVDFDRHRDHKRNFYDLSFNLLPFTSRYPMDKEAHLKVPKNYKEMLDIARTLSQDFIHVRVDLYNVEGKIYFGELTFYHGNGMETIEPLSYEKLLGSWLTLPKEGD